MGLLLMTNINDTIPKLFLSQYNKFPHDRVAVVQKDFGIWQTFTWQEQYETVKYFALGLQQLGLKKGDMVSIVGDSDRHWYWSRWAIMVAGGIVVGMYADSIPSELKYIAAHSDSKFVIADDQEQVDKMLLIQSELPEMKKIIFWDPKGLDNYTEDILISYDEVIDEGRKYENKNPDAFDKCINESKPEDIALLVYTSGTSAEPKGAILTHECVLESIRIYNRSEPFLENDRFFASPMPAWIAGPLFSTWVLYCGCTMYYPEEAETLQDNTREIAPEIMFYGARFWESIASLVLAKMVDATRIKRWLYFRALPIGYKVAEYKMQNKRQPLWLRTANVIAYWLVFRPLKDKLGLSRTRVGITAGAMTSPDTFKFFHAIGINLKQSYGMTEAMPVTHHRDGDINFETLGSIVANCEIRILDSGEILIRGNNVFSGYYHMPEKTAEVLQDGWFHTGDAGHVTNEGHVVILDRVDELRELSGGDRFAPQYIEARLRFSPYIKDAMVLGDGSRDTVNALINIDFDNCSRYAESHKVVYTTFNDLSQKKEIIDLIRKDIRRVNQTLPEFSRVFKFANLHKELDADEAELTRTRKLRRTVLENRLKELIDAVYSDNPTYAAAANINYQDGRTGTIKTVVQVNYVTEGGTQ
jgi:long-chain acyl-CoA synthetase